jgi:hypothetical protein
VNWFDVVALALVCAGLVLGVRSAFTRQRERPVLDRDLDVLVPETGQVGDEQDRVAFLDDVHRRHERTVEPALHAVERLAHELRHLVLERPNRLQRLPSDQRHGVVLLGLPTGN